MFVDNIIPQIKVREQLRCGKLKSAHLYDEREKN